MRGALRMEVRFLGVDARQGKARQGWNISVGARRESARKPLLTRARLREIRLTIPVFFPNYELDTLF